MKLFLTCKIWKTKLEFLVLFSECKSQTPVVKVLREHNIIVFIFSTKAIALTLSNKKQSIFLVALVFKFVMIC